MSWHSNHAPLIHCVGSHEAEQITGQAGLSERSPMQPLLRCSACFVNAAQCLPKVGHAPCLEMRCHVSACLAVFIPSLSFFPQDFPAVSQTW